MVVDGSHRALNRDVAGAISIGAMFYQILGLDLGRWQRHVIAEDTTLRGWNEIFDAHGLSCPLSICLNAVTEISRKKFFNTRCC